jgi:hypothetical protein
MHTCVCGCTPFLTVPHLLNVFFANANIPLLLIWSFSRFLCMRTFFFLCSRFLTSPLFSPHFYILLHLRTLFCVCASFFITSHYLYVWNFFLLMCKCFCDSARFLQLLVFYAHLHILCKFFSVYAHVLVRHFYTFTLAKFFAHEQVFLCLSIVGSLQQCIWMFLLLPYVFCSHLHTFCCNGARYSHSSLQSFSAHVYLILRLRFLSYCRILWLRICIIVSLCICAFVCPLLYVFAAHLHDFGLF